MIKFVFVRFDSEHCASQTQVQGFVYNVIATLQNIVTLYLKKILVQCPVEKTDREQSNF